MPQDRRHGSNIWPPTGLRRGKYVANNGQDPESLQPAEVPVTWAMVVQRLFSRPTSPKLVRESGRATPRPARRGSGLVAAFGQPFVYTPGIGLKRIRKCQRIPAFDPKDFPIKIVWQAFS